MKQINFNLNGYISVKLTEAGIKELERQHAELASQVPSIGKYVPYSVDEDGYTRFQGWNLMNRLGHMTHLCSDLPFQ
ncbi:hypothetical protein ACI3PL_21705, partial [Lacticaseibacillus paracasei]